MISRDTLERHVGELEDEVYELRREVVRLTKQVEEMRAAPRSVSAARVAEGMMATFNGMPVGLVVATPHPDSDSVDLARWYSTLLPGMSPSNENPYALAAGDKYEQVRIVNSGTRPPIGGGFAHMDATAEKLKPVPEPTRWRLLEVD